MRIALLALLAVAACDPFSPDLGDSPFRCGTDDPVCPDGYECVEHSPSERVCELGSGGQPDIDGGDDTIECNDDSSIEPNDSTANAWTTPIPNSMPSVSLVSLAICPTSDKDLYRFGVNVNGKNLHVTVTTEISDAPLALQILNGQGNVIANGTATSATVVEVPVNNLSVGTYYVQVAAATEGAQNNYALEIVTCDGAPCGG